MKINLLKKKCKKHNFRLHHYEVYAGIIDRVYMCGRCGEINSKELYPFYEKL